MPELRLKFNHNLRERDDYVAFHSAVKIRNFIEGELSLIPPDQDFELMR